MKANQKGFSVVEILIVIVVVGLLGVSGWLVYDRQKDKTADKEAASTQKTQQTNRNADSSKDSDYKIIGDIKYTVPASWKTAKGPFKDSEVANSGQFLLSPDYKEAGGGQLFIEAGAYVSFKELEWAGIDKSTSLDQATSVVKNIEVGYLDPKSVKLTTVSGKQVVMFDAGHTTDDVTVFHKTSSGQWLEVSFSTTAGGDGNYNAQDSPHYKVFSSWLGQFIKLNP
jgi:prepilin-type N-terminal cleavage/methylation domain-containing protein